MDSSFCYGKKVEKMTLSLNFEKTLQELGITEEFYKELLGDFLVQAETCLNVLEKLRGTDQFQEIASQAHAIKGAAANLRIEEIAKLGRELEIAAKETRDPKKIEEQLPLLKEAFAELRKLV